MAPRITGPLGTDDSSRFDDRGGELSDPLGGSKQVDYPDNRFGALQSAKKPTGLGKVWSAIRRNRQAEPKSEHPSLYPEMEAMAPPDELSRSQLGHSVLNIATPAGAGVVREEDIFLLSGFDDRYAVGILASDVSLAEAEGKFEALRKLKSLGFPTVSARPISVDGEPAALYDYEGFVSHSSDIVKKVFDPERDREPSWEIVGTSPALDGKTLDSLKRIRAGLCSKKIWLPDFDMIFTKDGPKYVAASDLDTENISARDARSSVSLGKLDALIKATEQRIRDERKRGGAPK